MATATLRPPTRQFEDRPAVRSQTPILVGLVGPSGSGKTFSALRLAEGIRRVSGGDIFVIDTEADRSLAYADYFAFRHLPFGAPFGPLDYLAAVEHCVRKGARTIVIDSMSHEHEGPGGVLEMHAAELDRMAGGDWKKAERMTMLAWQKPKAERRRLINSLVQLKVNLILCFRAKEKIKVISGKAPLQLGWMPIAGEEFVYEMTLSCLLYPGSNGVPAWAPEEAGEKQMIKLPIQFREMFTRPEPLTEETGERLARWAGGTVDAKGGTGDRWAKAVSAFDAQGVGEGRLLDLIQRANAADVTAADLDALGNHLKAIKAGKVKAADLFPPDSEDLSQDADEDTDTEWGEPESEGLRPGKRQGPAGGCVSGRAPQTPRIVSPMRN
jgi:hypothetical protein